VAQKETMTQQEMAILTAQEVKENNSTSFQKLAIRRTEEQAHKPTRTAYSTGRILLMLFSSIFVVEMLVMLLLALLPPFSTWAEALFDSTLLIVLLFPIIYFLLFRRMILHIGELERTKEALRRSQDEAGHAQRLLLAFSQAAQAVQRARTPDEVYRTVGEEVVRLGFHAVVFSLTADRASLIISHTTFGPILMQAAAKLTGLSVQDYRMPLVPGSFYQRIIAEGQTIFADQISTAEILVEALPGPLVSQLAALLGLEQGIVTRLTVGGEPHGTLLITGTGLTEADVPAVTAFASQTAIALENARAGEALRKSEEKYRTLAESSPDAIFILDRDERVIYVNQTAARWLGRPVAELVGQRQADLFPAETARHQNESLQRVLATGEAERREELTPFPGGVRWIETRLVPLLGPNDAVESVMGVSRDITESKRVEAELRKHREHLAELVEERTAELRKTNEALEAEIAERKRAEEALRVSEERFALAVQGANDGIWDWDIVNHTLYWSPRMKELLGYADDELDVSYDTFESHLHPADGERTKATIEAHLKNGGLYDVEQRLRTKSGEYHWFHARGQTLWDEEGNPIRMIGSSTDITERKRTEEKLKLTLADLERSNKELEQFAYVASHDLQEPLRMVSSYTQLLARRYQSQLDADANEFIAFAVDGANRMQRLINDLLAYSRVGTHGKGFELTDCTAVLDQALANLKAAIDKSGAVVTHDPLPTVMADNLQLVQLFQNLIGNAIKFHGEEPPRVHVSTEQKGNAWVFSVRDNGIGIEPRYTERIFILFQRLHTREEYPGTGIGLAICKKIAERHGGRIWVESQPGIGSTFYFTIPIGGNGP
jgi:PAS domain S-box-containing protein